MSWETRRLADLTTKIGSGATPRGGKGVYQDEGTSFVRSQNVYDLRFDHDGLAHISDQAADSLKGVTIESADVLVNITGESVTRTCIVDDDVLPARVSQHVAIVRAEPQSLDPVYLLYSLINPPTKAMLNTLSQAGATRRALTKGHLEALEIPVPPLKEQERIAGVLGAFDDLIETNRRLVRDIERLGKSLVASIQGDVGEIAETVRLSETCSVIESGRRPKGGVKGIASGVPSLGAESVNGLTEFEFAKTKYVPPEFAAQMKRGVLDDLDVLVYKDGGKPGEFFPDVSIVGYGYPFDDMVINEHVFRVRATPPLGQGYLYFWLSTDRVMDMMKEIGSRTAAIPGMNSTNFGQLPIDVPSSSWQSAHMDGLNSLVTGALSLLAENRDLARRRDELLPLLMSGRVRVRDVEAAVS